MFPPSPCAQLLFLNDPEYKDVPCCHPCFDFGPNHPASNARRPNCIRLCCNHPPQGGPMVPETPTQSTRQAHTVAGSETEVEEEEPPPAADPVPFSDTTQQLDGTETE